MSLKCIHVSLHPRHIWCETCNQCNMITNPNHAHNHCLVNFGACMIILFGSHSLSKKRLFILLSNHTPPPSHPNYVFYLSVEQWLTHFEHAVRFTEHMPFGVHISTPDHTQLKYRCRLNSSHWIKALVNVERAISIVANENSRILSKWLFFLRWRVLKVYQFLSNDL